MSPATRRSALHLVALAALASGCGGDTAGDDMNVADKDLSLAAADATGAPDQSLAKPDLSAADLSMATGDMSTQDLSASVMDHGMMGGSDAAPRDLPAAVGDGAAADANVSLDANVLQDANLGADLWRPDIFMPGDPGLGVFDAIMDGPGFLGDRPPCVGTPEPACQTCLGMKCGNLVIAAFGANWQTKDTGSVCAGIYACWCNCAVNKPNDPNCRNLCPAMIGQACVNAYNALAACVQQGCLMVCM